MGLYFVLPPLFFTLEVFSIPTFVEAVKLIDEESTEIEIIAEDVSLILWYMKKM